MLDGRAAAAAPSVAARDHRIGQCFPSAQPSQLHAHLQSVAQPQQDFAFTPPTMGHRAITIAASRESAPAAQCSQRPVLRGADSQQDGYNGFAQQRLGATASGDALHGNDPAAGGLCSPSVSPSQPSTAASQTAAGIAQPGVSPGASPMSLEASVTAHGAPLRPGARQALHLEANGDARLLEPCVVET